MRLSCLAMVGALFAFAVSSPVHAADVIPSAQRTDSFPQVIFIPKLESGIHGSLTNLGAFHVGNSKNKDSWQGISPEDIKKWFGFEVKVTESGKPGKVFITIKSSKVWNVAEVITGRVGTIKVGTVEAGTGVIPDVNRFSTKASAFHRNQVPLRLRLPATDSALVIEPLFRPMGIRNTRDVGRAR